MKCPITADGVLEHVGESHNGLVHYYKSTGNQALTFRRFRTEWSIIEMGKGDPRHFYIDGDMLVEVKKYGDKWLPLNATQEQVDAALAEHRSRLMSTMSNMKFPTIRNVRAKKIADKIIPVIPEVNPGKSMELIQYVFDSKDENVAVDKNARPDVSPDDCELVEYITGKIREITEDTIEKDKEFFGDEVAVGDSVYVWDMGGWKALAGRAGEAVFRGNVYVTSKLTRLS